MKSRSTHPVGLLISRDSAVLGIMTQVLAEALIDVTVCSNSNRVLELLSQNEFSILVVDTDALTAEMNTELNRRTALSLGAIVLSKPARPHARTDAQIVIAKPLSPTKARRYVRSFMRRF